MQFQIGLNFRISYICNDALNSCTYSKRGGSADFVHFLTVFFIILIIGSLYNSVKL